MYERSRQLMSFCVAGFSHWYGLEVLDQLAPGCELRIVAEPDNPYDSDAVALYFGDTKLGFVPADSNSVMSLLLAFGHGDILRAFVSQVDPTAHPEKQVRVSVFVTDARTKVSRHDAARSDDDSSL